MSIVARTFVESNSLEYYPRFVVKALTNEQHKLLVEKLRKSYASQNTRTLFNLYEIYDNHRQSILWFLEEFDTDSYEEYTEKYAGASSGRSNFIAVCGFFELSGVLVSHKMIDQNLYFDMFNPTPFWQKARFVIEGMRQKRPHIYENFESLANMRLSWTQLRTKKYRKKLTQKRQISL